MFFITAFPVQASSNLIFDFEGPNYDSSQTVSQTKSGETIQLKTTGGALISDDGSNYGVNRAGNVTGNFAYVDPYSPGAVKVVISLQSGNLFNLDSMDILEVIGQSEYVYIDAKNGSTSKGTIYYPIGGRGGTSISASNNARFQNITSVEITAFRPDVGDNTFFLGFDNINLSNIHSPLSSNANLSNLSLSDITLSPAFSPVTTNYTASVGNSTSSTTVTPTVADATATVTINGVTVTSGSSSGSIPLNVGSNTITVVVTAQDGTTKTYQVTVTRDATVLSSNANLSTLTLSAGILTPNFDSSTTTYTASVGNSTSNITVTPTVANPTATVKVNGATVTSGSSSGSIPLNEGSNTIMLVVTAQDGTTKTYQVTVTRSLNANLSTLTLSAGTLTPNFDSSTTTYTASVGDSISSITVTPIVADPTATVKVNGATVMSGSSSGSIPLNVGLNTITAVVTAQDGTTKTYKVTVSKVQSSNLIFDFEGSNYDSSQTVSQTKSGETIQLKTTGGALISDDGSNYGVNRAGNVTGNFAYVDPYSPGAVKVVISLQSGNLFNLDSMDILEVIGQSEYVYIDAKNGSTSKGTIYYPIGGRGGTSISASNNARFQNITSVEITAFRPDVGDNTFFLGFDNINLSNIHSPLSSNANLSNLSLSDITLSPAFSPVTTNYTASVGNSTSSTTVTPTVADATATVTINGVTVTSGSSSGSIPLNVGSNTITVVVTAQDGTTKTYQVTVTRDATVLSSNANLSTLTLSAGILTPNFDSSTTTYTASVGNSTSNITVTPTVANPTATVKVNGATVTSGSSSGSIPLNEGSNTIMLVVTAQDGTTKTYQVTVTRSLNANLSTLTLSAGTLTPNFDSSTTTYTASVGDSISSITVTPIVADPTATVKVNGATVMSGSSSGSIPLNVGLNTITAVVTAQDGTTKTYKVTVSKVQSSNLIFDFEGSNYDSSQTVSQTKSGETIQLKTTGGALISDDGSNYGVNRAGNVTGNFAYVDPYSPGAVKVVISLQSGNLFNLDSMDILEVIGQSEYVYIDAKNGSTSKGTIYYPIGGRGGTSISASNNARFQNITSVEITAFRPDVGDNTFFLGFDNINLSNIHSPLSSNANLSNLSLSDITLSPAFSPVTTNYTASVGNSTSSTTVTPTVADATATVTINGVTVTSGSSSGSIPLNEGSNTITVVVTAQDGTTKPYTIAVTRAASLSSNADLSSLTLSAGTLSPTFTAGMTSYTASVGNSTSSINVTPTLADSNATVTVNGNAVTSGIAYMVPLTVGSNTITVVVTAQDGTTKTYTITVTRAAALSTNADLSNLVFSQGTLSPAFSSGTTSYTASVGNAVSSLTITPTLSDSNATVTVNGTAVTNGTASGGIALTVGSNTITVVVTAQDGTTKTYTITVTRAAALSTNADLGNLVFSQGTLSPAFSSGTTSYTASVGNSVTSLTITPTLSDSNATVTVNGTAVTNGTASGGIALTVGSNTITVVVTAQDGTTKTYTITVTRAEALSTNADLSNLVFSQGTLSPAFSSGTTSYTASVGNSVTSLTITPTLSDSNATVTVNGTAVTNGTASGGIALTVGSNTITVVVTAQDGTTKTYTITVTRAAALSTNADLGNLVFSQGTLSPAFSSGTTSYTASVGNAVSSLTVTPTLSDSNAMITVNGTAVTNGTASGGIALTVGSNTITVEVTAQDGTTKTYTITVTRAAALSTNADLSNLVFSQGTLSPAFSSGTTSYTASVGNSVTSLTVTPTLSDSNATITVNGTAVTNGTASGGIALTVGSNTITVVVTAQDGTTKTYTITVTRAAALSTNADLSNLVFSQGTLSPAFSSGTTSYTASVGNSVTSLTVTPTLSDSNATITVNGTAVTNGTASGGIALTVGSNTITVVVTAQDGTTKTYTITVTRAAALSTNADLSNLVFSQGTLSPAFSSGTTSYTVSVGNSVTSLTVTPTLSDSNATITVNGTAVTNGTASGGIALTVGSNTITVVVTAQDGTTKTYTITVTRAAALSTNADLSNLVFSQGTLSPAFSSGTTSYTASVGNSVTSLTVTPTLSDSNATITVNGTAVTNGTASGGIALTVGSNTITVVVTAQDGTTKTYTITVTRAAALSTNADLSNLVFSQGTLSPAFSSGTTSYTVSVGNSVTSLTVTPTLSDSNATVTVNGTVVTNGTASGGIALTVGSNTITVEVTAQDGTTKTYTITVTRAEALSTNADLSNLVFSQGTLSPAFSSGTTSYTVSVGNSVTSLTVTPTLSDSNATVTVNGTVVTNGTASGGIALTVGSNTITVVVKAQDGMTTKTYTITITKVVIPSTGGGSGGGSSTPSTPNNGVDVLVNEKVENVGTATTTKVNGQTVTTVAVDAKKLEEKLAAEGQHIVITIPVNTKNDVVVGELTGQMVKNMEQKQAVVEIKTENATYTLPAQQINIDAISDQVGKGVALQDIKIHIEIAKPTAETMKVVENAAAKGKFTIVAPPLNFTVTGTYGDRTIDVAKFNAYVERTIAIPDGVDPNKITTAIVVDSDGTVRHVPTKVVAIDGKYYVKVNSLTNSTYSVVWHPVAFQDVEHHWAKATVNDMGSRMVIGGVRNDKFNPDQDITRAEFAAIVVRGLGLKPESSSSPFTDVKTTDWYSSTVQTAYVSKLIGGFTDGTFRPNDKITREQAMVIIAKAMKTTGLQTKLQAKEAGELLQPFTDANKASEWAKSSLADCLQAGLISGRNGKQLAPKEYITRSEVAALVQRLLQNSELI
ncbi:cadherin-like beta sandwich domain-containing protein [Aneurinibacillus uraniidurans]|uniref:cadherin-like beta sandwich domain-containing protein n=1 Tax=Aneurinibacillus uraniidurans TaxID=2966586 RepID=UPI002349BD0E|nr:cadherin-like beta sandwich domain-containing protein [Aneurinibacillus sp. B1]WCN37300.1 cadherin-like beta sandwich domain-containing protein [Aneurinibacillus sp. B1]